MRKLDYPKKKIEKVKLCPDFKSFSVIIEFRTCVEKVEVGEEGFEGTKPKLCFQRKSRAFKTWREDLKRREMESILAKEGDDYR